MNNNSNNNEIIVDVPYYTRGISANNNFRVSRRNINSKNIIDYKKKIFQLQANNQQFFTEKLNNTISNAGRLLK